MQIATLETILGGIRFGLLNKEEDLRLTPEEISLYFDNKLMRRDRILSLEGSMPALHSEGSATRSCPCGCREGGFKYSRLETLGLRGPVVTSAHDDIGCGRPHPKEVALALGFPPFMASLAN